MNSRSGGKSFEDSRNIAGGYSAQDQSRQELMNSTNQAMNTSTGSNSNSQPQQQKSGVSSHGGSGMSQGNIPGNSQNIGGTRDSENPRDLAVREKPQPRGGGGKSSSQRTCMKCNLPLTGQFVRAIGGTFHLECFKCQVNTRDKHLLSARTDTFIQGLWADRCVKVFSS